MITLKDIARLLVAKHQISSVEAETFVQQMVEVIHEGLVNDRLVKIKGFGTFKLATMKERNSVNVRTGERVTIGEHDKITFTPDNVMRDIINKPFAQFETVIIEDDSPLLDESFELQDDDDETNTETNAELETEKQEPTVETPVVKTPVAEEAVVEKSVVETPIVEEPVVEEPVAEEPEPMVAEEEPQTEEKIEEPKTDDDDEVPELSGEEQKPEYDAKVFVEANVTLKSDENGENGDADEDEEYCECDKKHPLCRNILIYYGILINIIVAIIFFFIGYFAAENEWFSTSNEPEKNTEQVATAGKTVAKPQKTAIPSKSVEKKDSVKPSDKAEEATTKATENNSAKAETPTSKTETATAKAETPTAKAESVAKKEPQPMRQFDSDARVRTGAYYIMGTKQEVKVKEGQTLKQIARTYLGPDMECYIEAYNGKKEVKAGETVKIPELLLKKRLKK